MGTVTRLAAVEFDGDIRKAKNVSAVDVVGDLLVLGADETNLVQVLNRRRDRFEVSHDIVLNPAAEEIDIEGIAHDGDAVYVLGSHSWKRKKLDPAKPYETNLAALAKVAAEPDRDHLYRFRLGADGKPSQLTQTTLRPFLDGHAVLNVFARTPGKENGIDLEGVAVRDGWLFAGFRSPVLRGNLVPIFRCRFANPVAEGTLLYLNLGGRGVRELTSVRDGFLVLAGPSGEGPGSTQLYFWDGRDCLPGVRSAGPSGRVELLGELPGDPDARAEGVALLGETASGYDIMVVFDGAKNGGPTRFHVTRS